jgi:hypothetical protein
VTSESAAAARPSIWRRRAIVGLVVVLVLLVLRVGLDLWFGHQLRVDVARLEKVYGDLDLRSMAPPKVPPSENRARIVRAAASLTTIDQWQKLSAFVGASPEQVNPALRAEMARLLDQNRLTLTVAAEIQTRTKSNWDIDYPEANRTPPLLDIRGLSNLLAAASRADSDAGRPDAALQKSASGLAVAESLGVEPQALLQMMRIGIAVDQLRAVQRALAGEPAKQSLADLAKVLAEARTPDPVRTLLVCEMKFANQMWARMEGGQSVEGLFPGPSPAWASPASWLFRPVVRAVRLHYLRAMGRLLDFDTTPPFARTQPFALPATSLRWWQFKERFDAAFLTGVDRMAGGGYRFLSALNVAEIGVALRRFRLDAGAYPESLDQLAPRYLARLPIDPFTGRPPDYARDGSGFALTGHGPKVMSVADHALLEWKIAR